jgi:hypothetical protein
MFSETKASADRCAFMRTAASAIILSISAGVSLLLLLPPALPPAVRLLLLVAELG